MSARTNCVKNDRVSAIDAIEAPTPPAPITKMFITHQFFECATYVAQSSVAVSLPVLFVKRHSANQQQTQAFLHL